MRTVLKILTSLWIALWLVLGTLMFLETPKQIEKDKKFIADEIKPSVDFVKNFKMTNNRLPTNREYYNWQREYFKDYSSDMKQQVDSLTPGFGRNRYIRKLTDVVIDDDYSKFKNADWNKDFAIGIWRGEWTEYYFSWTDNYDSNNYSWGDGFFGLAIMIGIGLFPLLFWWRDYRQRLYSASVVCNT
ncbi:MAG: hypothetical protein IPL53_09215 [Ignavibacteria bacterium]|nr:hypothetical protein [Ignavibacteria bacterium]